LHEFVKLSMPFLFLRGYGLRRLVVWFFANGKKDISVRSGISVLAIGKTEGRDSKELLRWRCGGQMSERFKIVSFVDAFVYRFWRHAVEYLLKIMQELQFVASFMSIYLRACHEC